MIIVVFIQLNSQFTLHALQHHRFIMRQARSLTQRFSKVSSTIFTAKLFFLTNEIMSNYSNSDGFYNKDNPYSKRNLDANNFIHYHKTVPDDFNQFYTDDQQNQSMVYCHHPNSNYPNEYIDNECGQQIRKNYKKGHLTKHYPPQYQCAICGVWYKQPCNAKRHVERVHFGQQTSYECSLCGRSFTTKYSGLNHVHKQHNF